MDSHKKGVQRTPLSKSATIPVKPAEQLIIHDSLRLP